MPSIAEHVRPVTGGVDTHAEVHVAAVVDQVGRVLGTETFSATAPGYQAALAWMGGFGELGTVGIEGTGSYGAGLARHLAAQGVAVVEVIRPNRQARRRRGKSQAGDVEAIRALQVARRSAVKASTQAANQLRDLIVTGPQVLRAQLGALSTRQRVARAARFRARDRAEPLRGTMQAMADLARRYQRLQAEISELDTALDELVARAAPALLDRQGIATHGAAALLTTVGDNPDRLGREASFAALCGASPVDASSGKQRRHRLNRGGDRQANSALWRVVFVRMSHDPRTKAYVAKRTAEGKTTKEIMRCLKRYVAREVYKILVRPARNAATVSTAA